MYHRQCICYIFCQIVLAPHLCFNTRISIPSHLFYNIRTGKSWRICQVAPHIPHVPYASYSAIKVHKSNIYAAYFCCYPFRLIDIQIYFHYKFFAKITHQFNHQLLDYFIWSGIKNPMVIPWNFFLIYICYRHPCSPYTQVIDYG